MNKKTPKNHLTPFLIWRMSLNFKFLLRTEQTLCTLEPYTWDLQTHSQSRLCSIRAPSILPLPPPFVMISWLVIINSKFMIKLIMISSLKRWKIDARPNHMICINPTHQKSYLSLLRNSLTDLPIFKDSFGRIRLVSIQ